MDIMMTANSIQASRYTPILPSDESARTGTIRNRAVRTAVATAKTMTFGHVMLIPPNTRSVIFLMI